MTLGIFYRLFKLLEDACHELDLIVKFSDSRAGSSYERHLNATRQQKTLKETEERLMSQVEGMEQLVTSVSLALPGAVAQPAYRRLCQELMNRRERLKKVVNSTQIIIII